MVWKRCSSKGARQISRYRAVSRGCQIGNGRKDRLLGCLGRKDRTVYAAIILTTTHRSMTILVALFLLAAICPLFGWAFDRESERAARMSPEERAWLRYGLD